MANLNETKIYGSLELDGPLLDSTGSAGTSGQVLLSTGGTTKWVSVSGASSGSTPLNTYCQFNGTGVTDPDPFVTPETELAWMNTSNVFTTNSASWTNNGTRITVPSNGFYLITVSLYYFCTSGIRPTIKNRLAIDGTGIADTFCRNTYIRQAQEHRESTANFQSILRLASGKQISILFQKDASDNTSNIKLDASKSSISIIKVKSYT